MQKACRRLRSSALLIAMVVGVVISATLFGLVAATNQYLKIAGQSRDGKIAYQAALSGVEDGILRYKYALSQGKANLVMRSFDQDNSEGKFDQFKIDNFTDAYYNLSIRADSLSLGSDLGMVNWYSDATNAINQKAKPLLADDTFEIDLSYLMKQAADVPDQINIIFSSPFVKSNGKYSSSDGGISGYFSALNYQLINFSARGEEQIISEDINKISSNHSLSVTNLFQCAASSAQCRLRITPRVVKSNIGINSNSRLSGSQSAGVLNQKYVFIKIEARDGGAVIDPKAYDPGTLVVEAIGASGDAKRKVQVQIDSTSGKYLGMFDFGVYCGDKCVMP